MRDPIKLKEKNQIRRYTCIKSKECATTVVNIGARLEVVQKEEKKSTVHTAKNVDILLKNVTSRRIMGKNARSVTRKFTMKRSDGRHKHLTKKKKSKSIISIKIYIMSRFVL